MIRDKRKLNSTDVVDALTVLFYPARSSGVQKVGR